MLAGYTRVTKQKVRQGESKNWIVHMVNFLFCFLFFADPPHVYLERNGDGEDERREESKASRSRGETKWTRTLLLLDLTVSCQTQL